MADEIVTITPYWGPKELLEKMFNREANQANLKWLWRQRRARHIPCIKLGQGIYFDPPAVREALSRHNTIKAR